MVGGAVKGKYVNRNLQTIQPEHPTQSEMGRHHRRGLDNPHHRGGGDHFLFRVCEPDGAVQTRSGEPDYTGHLRLAGDFYLHCLGAGAEQRFGKRVKDRREERKMNDQPTFFDFAAEVGLTKHIGGIAAIEALIELCHIGRESTVLDVGCDAGATACFIAKRVGCRVVGVDILEKMVECSRERAARKKMTQRVEFRVADEYFGYGLFVGRKE